MTLHTTSLKVLIPEAFQQKHKHPTELEARVSLGLGFRCPYVNMLRKETVLRGRDLFRLPEENWIASPLWR